MKRKNVIVPLILLAITFFQSCNKEDEKPDLSGIIFNLRLNNINGHLADLSCYLTNPSSISINEHGLCWNTTGNPTTNDLKKKLGELSGTSFNEIIDGLNPETDYYVKAYITVQGETIYSDELKIITTNGLPVIFTVKISNITATTAIIGGEVTDNGGFEITARGVCWSESPTPSLEDNYSSEGIGTGSFASSIYGLTEWTIYYVRTYASNKIGTVFGEELTFRSNNPVQDYDGNKYQTVKIGNQIWMVENLKTIHYADGTPLVDGTNAGNIQYDYITKYYFAYDNDENNVYTYGRLYSWAAVMNGTESSTDNPSGVQGVCPDGWHVPSDDEWKELEMFLGMSKIDADATRWRGADEGNKLKSNNGWTSGNGSNESGFSALPAGSRGSSNYFHGRGYWAYFWSSSENSYSPWYRILHGLHDDVDRYTLPKDYSLSVRCLKD